ncbi:MAG: M14 family zinc carboxypeptidase [Runella sp.]
MQKNSLLLVVGLLLTLQGFSQLQSPTQFFGFAPGEQFLPTHRLYEYAQHAAQQRPNQVKIINYGQTFEKRALLLVVVASEENMRNLEQIRTDHLKSIGMLAGQPTSKTRPTFTWMSYNVHGNEATNSAAFPKVLHELLAGGSVADKILKNSIIILGPCLNPDGHDRYVNWYNQKVGATPNANTSAWEHGEPWPGGRWTHYLFDPNRDWAWQTQEITRQLVAEYHKWMPQVHGDFHEMGPNSPYYFAPSAKPYHEDITTWQREMQEVVGNYNKKYFDRNHWLYYTRERFDLFYPSYGDTWPTYNGAIAMTYEQGGGGIAGLAYDRPDEGDTLRLTDRVAHVAAASIATMEAIADRAPKVVEEFVKFYDRAQNNPIGVYKSYIIKTTGDEGRVKALKELLDKNQIRYGYAADSKSFTGFNYLTQKEEAFRSEVGDVIISAYQPKSGLLKILFETKPTLEDSVTYDITSWCVPLAYGAKVYGVKERLISAANAPIQPSANISGQPYAYLATWKSAEDAKFLAAIARQKVRVRAAEKPFEIGEKKYAAGTLIITRAGNEALGEKFDKIIQTEAQKLGIALQTTESGAVSKGSDFGSDFVNVLKTTPRVGLIAGEGTSATNVGSIWHFFDQELQYPLTLIDPNSRFGSGIPFNKFDVLIVPAGGNTLIRDNQLSALREWLRAGGRLILMETATSLLADKEGFGLKNKKDEVKKSDKKTATDSLKIYANRERESVSDETPGSIYKIKLDNTHPLAFGFPDYFFALVNNTYNYELLKDGWNVGYLKKEKEGYVAGFTGRNAKEKLQNVLFYGVEDIGRGKVVYMANDPLFRGFWYNGKLLFANAVFMLP